jgi:hypothetical protein
MNELIELEDRLRATLRRKADQIEVPASEYAPDAVRVVELADVGRPRHRLVYAAAGIAITIAVGAAVLVATSGDAGRNPSRGRQQPPMTSGVTSQPVGPALAPSYVPPGLQLWDMKTRSDAHGPFAYTTQLFGVVDATGAPSPGILLRIQPGAGGAVGDPVTVRGMTGSSAAPKEGVETSETISWDEGGAAVSATVRGLSREEAVAALNSLRLRSSDPRDGYEPGSLPLLGETLAKSAPVASIGGTFQYASGPLVNGTPAVLRVETATHADYPGYLGFWIEGTRAGDGSVLKRDPGWGVDAAWPDGRQVLVYSKTDDWPTLERIALGARSTSPSDLAVLQQGVDRRLAAMPVIVTASLNGSKVELRGVNAPAVLCIDRDGTSRCGSPFGAEGETGDPLEVSAIIDGAWRLVVASRVPVQIRADTTGTGPDLAQHVTTNGWDFALADVPADLGQVMVFAGPDFHQGTGAGRPND